jgi:hypothetical protein
MKPQGTQREGYKMSQNILTSNIFPVLSAPKSSIGDLYKETPSPPCGRGLG